MRVVTENNLAALRAHERRLFISFEGSPHVRDPQVRHAIIDSIILMRSGSHFHSPSNVERQNSEREAILDAQLSAMGYIPSVVSEGNRELMRVDIASYRAKEISDYNPQSAFGRAVRRIADLAISATPTVPAALRR